MLTTDSLDELAGSMKDEFVCLFKALNERPGDTEEYKKKERVVTQFIADLPLGSRVWARGNVNGVNRYHPAVLIYSAVSDEVKVLAPSGLNFAMETHPLDMFWSKVPHIAFSRSLKAQAEQNSSS